MPAFRICIFSSAWTPTQHLQHFLWRVSTDLPKAEVAGILYEVERPPLGRKKRIKRAQKYLREQDYIRYVAHNIFARVSGKLGKIPKRLLHLAHGTDGSPNLAYVGLEELVRECAGRGIVFKIVKDVHNDASLEFVKGLRADIGVTFGARILKPQLFSIPLRGSINSHQHKLPDYRGSGAPGLWEICDGKTELTVTAHRLNVEVDGGAVLDERSFPIEPFDTLTSLALKANLAGVDGLIDVIRLEVRGKSVEVPQPTEGTIYKGIQPHRMWAMEEIIRKKRRPFLPSTRCPFHKRAKRMLAYPALFFRNRQWARDKNFPVVILSYQLISDRAKHGSLSTDYFLRHVHFLKEYYRIVSLPDALEMLEKGAVNAPTVVLTFDDGYAENFLSLRSVIEPENIPATLFVCTRHITERSKFKHDIDRGEHGFPALGWEEIRYFDKHNVCIGSHTRTHFDCGSTDEEKLLDEISGSLEDLRRELGHDVYYFSFPKGCPENMSEPARRIALRSYPYLFSTCGGANWGPLPSGTIIKRCRQPESLWDLELLLQSISKLD